jgi:hypothetical protein
MPGRFYLLHTEEYGEPVEMTGPFLTYNAAMQAFWDGMLAAGYEPAEGETPERLYLDSDNIRIGKHTQTPRKET